MTEGCAEGDGSKAESESGAEREGMLKAAALCRM
jgi:hypothetical protein